MNWDALGASAEAIGALAIIITLIYLSVQVRQAKLASADTNRLTRASGVRDMILLGLQDEGLRGVSLAMYGGEYEKYAAEFSERFGFSKKDVQVVDLYTQFYLWLHWGQFSTTMTPADELELRNIASVFYNVPAIRYAWENSLLTRPNMDAKFSAFIDSVLEKPTAD